MTFTPIDHTAVDRKEVSRAAFGYLVVDDLNDLNTRTTAVETTVNAAGTTAAGNAALSSRLGTGVTTASTATAQLATKAPTSRLITAGTGLTGGGDLSADRTLTVAYGNTSTTAASGDRATALETIVSTRGRWYLASTVTNYTSAANVAFDTVDGDAASGMTLSSGVVTITATGDYSAAATVSGRATGAGNMTLAIVHTSGANTYYRAGTTQAITATGDFLLNLAMDDTKVTAGDTLAVNFSWSGITSVAKAATGFVVATVRSTNFGINRVR